MKDAGDYVTDFHLSFEPMQALGWRIDEVPWRSSPDWNVYDAVYVCSPWDYPQHAEEFLQVLRAIDDSSAALCNDLSTIRWNLDKTYLRDIESDGGEIVPSSWHRDLAETDIAAFFAHHKSSRLVIKPTIGANAMDTFVLQQPVENMLQQELIETFSDRDFIVQPFVENIQKQGEFSLFFFDGHFSHAILKTPQAGDFRVQEEHGASIASTEPPDELLQVAARIFSRLQPVPVYGRGDWVHSDDGRYQLMELELIEPSLYLRTNSGAAARFARAFDQWFEKLAGK